MVPHSFLRRPIGNIRALFIALMMVSLALRRDPSTTLRVTVLEVRANNLVAPDSIFVNELSNTYRDDRKGGSR